MAKVKELIEFLSNFDDNIEIVIYPKYSAHKVDGVKRHKIRIDQIHEQEPFGAKIKYDQEKLKEYFGKRKPESYELNNHLAIIF